MKILHCCLSCFYCDGFGYQENILPKINSHDGNDVLIIASTETIVDGKITYTKPSDYNTEYGVRIVRLPYAWYLPGFLGQKLRVIPGFWNALCEFSPDVILFHGSCGYEITTAARYKRQHPNVKLYVDSHEAFYNSARNWVSKNILHGLFYRTWYKKAMPDIDKVLYIGSHEMLYMRDFLHTPEELLEFFPLGGEMMPPEEKSALRKRLRAELCIDDDTLLFVHSGKITPLKKTAELMRAFSSNRSMKANLIIIGTVAKEMSEEFDACLENDSRIRFLGWKSSVELKNYICAADMYLQPGSPSATMQMSLCCGTPVMVQNADFYMMYVKSGACVQVSGEEDMRTFFSVEHDATYYSDMSAKAYEFSAESLDYKKLAARLYC